MIRPRLLDRVGRGPAARLPIVIGIASVCLMACTGVATAAQPSTDLDTLAADVRAISAADDGNGDAALQHRLRDRALDAAHRSRIALSALQAELARNDDRAAQLGAAPSGIGEAPDIVQYRTTLVRRHSELDSAIKRLKLIAIDADQIASGIERRRAEVWSAQLAERTISPVLPAFWRSVAIALPAALTRIGGFMAVQADATWDGTKSARGWLASAGLIAALLLIAPVRAALGRSGRDFMIDHAPGSRIRRSGLALWLTLLGTLVPWAGSLLLVGSFRSAGMLSRQWVPLSLAFDRAVLMASLIGALATALLQPAQPSWRLLALSEPTACRLVPWGRLVAATAFISIVASGFVDTIGLGKPVARLFDLVVTVVHLGLVLAILLVLGRIRIAAAAATRADVSDDRALAGLALFTLLAWITGLVAFVAVLAGYGTLALLLSRLLLWLPTVAAALYLCLVVADDVCTELIARESAFGRTVHQAFGLRPSVIDQLGVALSATVRLMMVLAGIGIAFSPFGANLDQLFDNAVRLSHGVTIGAVTISPGAILQAIVVLACGLFAVRIAHAWLTGRYLPTTDLDAGARNSVSTVAGYCGIILAILWALAALGIGLERIALILSALSVGIGFGLQAITQNFVSGLILLIERPVKIGDLIRVGNEEGDVKRISVRATEIVVSDKSTLIVPNSELITKTIRNMTLADPIGRVQIPFAVPIDADVARVRSIVTRAFADHAGVLAQPAPTIFLDSLAGGNASFKCIAYVASPRAVYGVRSDLQFTLLEELRAAGIVLAGEGAIEKQAGLAGRVAETD